MSTLIIIYLSIGALWAGACAISSLADLRALAREEQRAGGIHPSAIALAMAVGVLAKAAMTTLAWPWLVFRAFGSGGKGA